MIITENQAIEYLTGLYLLMKKKIEIFDNNNSDNTNSPINADDFLITPEERLMCESMELVIQKARANIMFQKESDK